jgi:hypothetical protein
VDLGLEKLFTVDGRPREAFVPRHAVAPAEAGTGRGGADPALDLALEVLRRAR